FHVTGVQTCALPISAARRRPSSSARTPTTARTGAAQAAPAAREPAPEAQLPARARCSAPQPGHGVVLVQDVLAHLVLEEGQQRRSEERRVGQEGEER